MGGWNSMITPETKNILVEAAWFDQASIRRSSRRHGLHTDASHRFERGADFNACPTANALVSDLILQHGGHAEGALIDVVVPEIAARTAYRPPIQLSLQQVQRHLGATLDDTPTHSALTSELVLQYLTALGCTLAPEATALADESYFSLNARADFGVFPPLDVLSLGLESNLNPSNNVLQDLSSTLTGYFNFQLPSWRLDLEREIDLIEEVARVYGYNRFANTLPTALPVIAHPTAAKEAAVRTRLLALGYSESISSTFASQHDADLFAATNPGAPPFASSAKGGVSSEPGSLTSVSARWGGEARPLSSMEATTVPMENPLSEEASLLRPSLVPGMLNMLAHNLNRDVKEVRLFEQGHIFTGTVPADGTFISDVHESPQLSLGLTGNVPLTDKYAAQSPPFFELKGAIESLVSLFDLTNQANLSFRPEAAQSAAAVEKPAVPSSVAVPLTFSTEAPAWLRPGHSATALLNNEPLAHFGELASAEAAQRKLRQPVYLAQLDLARLYDLPLKRVTAHDLSRFQAVERDFSFVFPDTVLWHTVASAIYALAIPELQSLKPVEVWRNPKYPGVYSLLLRAVFQSNDRTLRDDELTTWWFDIIATLTSLGGTLRAPGEK